MLFISLGFFLGIIGTLQLKTLPEYPLWLLIVLLLLALWALKKYPTIRFFIAMVLGSLWLILQAHFTLAQSIPSAWENKNLQVQGYIHSLVQTKHSRHHRYQQFEFTVTRLFNQHQTFWSTPTKIRLTWAKSPQLSAGQQWQLTVRLKRPHGYANQNGFDEQKWFLSQGLRAKGSVRQANNQQIKLALTAWQTLVYQLSTFIQTKREHLRQAIQLQLADHPQQSLIQALVIGDKQNISDEQWRVLRETGTIHLMVISGLHIGLVAFFGFLLGRWIWRLSTPLLLYLPTPYFSALVAGIFALFYALLAGFSLPTQRALVMLGFFLWGILRDKRYSLVYILSFSALCLLIIQPFSTLSSSFYLTFLAVAIISYAFNGRTIVFQADTKTPINYLLIGIKNRFGIDTSVLQKIDNLLIRKLNSFFSGEWLRVYWVMFIGFMPIIFIFFHQMPLFSLFLNILAVPVVSFVVVPSALIAVIFLPYAPSFSNYLLNFSADRLDGLWSILASSSQSSFALWQPAFIPWYWSAVALVGLLILWLPRRFPARWLGLCLLLPWLTFEVEKPTADDVWLDVLDVGQGLAVLVRTAQHSLLYDTGKGNAISSRAKKIILPLLQANGIDKLDVLMISHRDNDHSGGMAHLLARYPQTHLISSVNYDKAEACNQQHWWWDGVFFELLYPQSNTDYLGNNSSCVLKISHKKGKILLTGDIEKEIEFYLLNQHKDVTADILLVPHHGSKTSSSRKFIRYVDPDYAIFTTGYLNRWHFPHRDILQRYQQQGITTLNTATLGQIQFRIDKQGIHAPTSQRQQAVYFWQSANVDDK